MRKHVLLGISAALLLLAGCGQKVPDGPTEEAVQESKVELDITEHYITNTGDPANLYYIDAENVLWGCGQNVYGQLGQGTKGTDFQEDMVKIAEHVVHVDYSQRGFAIYLTEEGKLYGMGNGGCGALQQLDEFSRDAYLDGSEYAVTTPVLLMENVAYARCGDSDVVCLTRDSEVWIWGTIAYDGNLDEIAGFVAEPVQVLKDAVLVTGGRYNHAALQADGSVWTWGYNYAGNCGVEGQSIVWKPTKVAEDAVMVWTGRMEYNVDCYDIAEFEGFYERGMENTIIQKKDGSCWACGLGIGTEEKVLPKYWETVDWPVVCSDVFLPYEGLEQ